MNNNDPLFQRFKALSENKDRETKRDEFLKSDFPSFFFRILVNVFEARGKILKGAGIDFDFQYFEGSSYYDSRYDPDSYNYDPDAELRDRFELWRSEELNRDNIDDSTTELIHEISFSDFKKNADNFYPIDYCSDDDEEEEDDILEKIGYIDLDCKNSYFEIRYEDLLVRIQVLQKSTNITRYTSKLNKSEYLDYITGDHLNSDIDFRKYNDGHFLVIFSYYLNIKYSNEKEFIEDNNYSISISEDLTALWGKETDYSLTDIVFSWFIEQLEN